MTTTDIATLLGIAPRRQDFTFNGRAFRYHPRDEHSRSAEALQTSWAEGVRSASPLNLRNDETLRRQLGSLLAHKFRRPLNLGEADAVIAEVRAALSAAALADAGVQ